jgi:TIR domain/Pentapeptide repeats (8 copies)
LPPDQSVVSFFSAFATSFRMANEEHLQKLMQGVKVWNKWMERQAFQRREIQPEFSGADLHGTNLYGVNLRGANLRLANLNGAMLSNADLWSANLYRANLSRANLSGANLGRADLKLAYLVQGDLSLASLIGANLTGANLSGTNLRRAEVDLADLSNCIMSSTMLAALDLRHVVGLETVQHRGPSEMGVSTIYMSQGGIPEVFLRGAGVPENFIEYMSSLTGTAFEFYSCFISYSGKDQEFADRLFADLQREGVRCWFAPHHVQAGKKLHEQIDVAIRMHEKLLLILSPDSINSEWVKTEIAKARKREIQDGKRVLFPIRLNISFTELQEWGCFDADRGKDSAREIREYYIPDFTKWKNHDQYQKEFKKLIRDLKK